MVAIGKSEDRRQHIRATLVGSALVGPKGQTGRALSAVLDNASRIGGGFHAKEQIGANEPVTVTIAFLDQNEMEQQEKLSGKVAWAKPWEKGFLIGVTWDEIVTKEKHPGLHAYLEAILKETA